MRRRAGEEREQPAEVFLQPPSGHYVLHPKVAWYEDTSSTINDYDTTEETEANIFASVDDIEHDEGGHERVLREHTRKVGEGFVYTLLSLPYQA